VPADPDNRPSTAPDPPATGARRPAKNGEGGGREITQKLTGESLRRLAREVARQVRRHDLPFYAAGLTFYAAIAVVPLLLVAWFVTSLALGDEVVRTLTLALAEYAPTSLGLREGVRSLGEVGPRLGIASLAAALIPATSYGDGLVRAMDRVAERDRRAKGLRGRGLALVFVAALPPVVMGELGAVAVLPGALGFTGRFNLVSLGVAFAAGLLVGVLYRAFSPRPIGSGALALGATLTGAFLAGMSLTWLFLLRFGVDVGVAFGDSDLLGTVVVAAVYLYLVQVVLLGGYVVSLVLARTATSTAPEPPRAPTARGRRGLTQTGAVRRPLH
jgi:membrane protein